MVHFPEYTKEQLVEILARTSPHTLYPFGKLIKRNGKIFREFAAILYDTAYRFCRNLTEMQHLATQIYPSFVQPLLDDPSKSLIVPANAPACKLESHALFIKSKALFENATQSIYARGNLSFEPDVPAQGTKRKGKVGPRIF